ncbi:hypothetical protein LEMLEM_LOCUS10743, partial [Lemmus lemmus]
PLPPPDHRIPSFDPCACAQQPLRTTPASNESGWLLAAALNFLQRRQETEQRPSAVRFNCQTLTTGQSCLSSKLKKSS